jgi:hypothetical protein
MSTQERIEFLEAIEKHRIKVTKNKQAARKFLVKIGVFNKDGKLTPPYKHLCIPSAQD